MDDDFTDEYDPYDYREDQEWFNEPLPESPKKTNHKLWQADPPPIPTPPTAQLVEHGDGDTHGAWGLTGLVVGLFIVVLLLLALSF